MICEIESLTELSWHIDIHMVHPLVVPYMGHGIFNYPVFFLQHHVHL